MSDYILKASNLSKIYPGDGIEVVALKEASFEIHPGEFVVVLGPSGSGKSTLLNIIGGMDQPSGGELFYQGENMTELSKDQMSDYRRDAIGFVFQFFNLIPSLTALENVELAASMSKEAKDPREALAMVNLQGREKHFPSQMSGGEQQRVSIARAIVKTPKLLLCDEPTGALDSQNSVDVVRLLLQVRDQLGCPVVAITHNAEMAKVADRVFYMKDGTLARIEENTHPLPVEELEW